MHPLLMEMRHAERRLQVLPQLSIEISGANGEAKHTSAKKMLVDGVLRSNGQPLRLLYLVKLVALPSTRKYTLADVPTHAHPTNTTEKMMT